MLILAIDPGTDKSGWVLYEPTTMTIKDACLKDNKSALLVLDELDDHEKKDVFLVLERVVCQGMPVGKETFSTVEFLGACLYGYYGIYGWDTRHHYTVTRHQVKIHLCGTARAKDANIRQSIIDRFPPTGGGKCRQIGTKKEPGPLFRVKSHCWSALAVAMTWYETTLFGDKAK
jgi:hypothetical protein